jgi:hypothetical protein
MNSEIINFRVVPMTTINKLTRGLDAIGMESDRGRKADVGLIYVIANETLKETAPEIDNIIANAT